MSIARPNFHYPYAPHRLKIYIAGTIVETLFIMVPLLCVQFDILKPTFTLDVIANVVVTLSFVFLPFIVLWDAPGEARTRLQKGIELTLVWLPFTIFSQLAYELPFLIGNVFDLWKPTRDPGWQWAWWTYAQADTRWWGTHPWIFAVELVAVLASFALSPVAIRLHRASTDDESRIRLLWVAFIGITMMVATTLVYFASEFRVGFADIGQGLYGIGFKFIFMNLAYMVFPPFVLYAIYLQIDYLTRLSGPRDNVTDGRVAAAERSESVTAET